VEATAGIPRTADINLPYPNEVTLIEETAGWTFRQSGTGMPLYLSQQDPLGRSGCNRSCSTQWPPLLAPAGAKTLGEWTVILRQDGKRQWAFQRHPVYLHIHDQPERPKGEHVGGSWHLMPHFQARS
jgi:predicted lipoprotein with Yx(FWY)xxD motif